MGGLGQSPALVAAFDMEGNTMSESSYLGSLMGSPSDTEEFTPPITRDQAKARGLKVFQSRYYCRRSSKHGALKVGVVTQPEGPQTAQVGPEVAPWDEPKVLHLEAPQRAPQRDDRAEAGSRCPADDEGAEAPW